MRKKILTAVLAGAMVLSLGACGKKEETTTATTTASETVTEVSEEVTETVEDTTEAVEDTTEAVDANDEAINELLANLQSHQDETQTADMKVSMKLSGEMPVDESGATQDVSMDMSADMTIKGNKEAAHCVGSVKIVSSAAGLDETSPMENYTVIEDGKFVSYTSMDGSTWEKIATDEIQLNTDTFTQTLTTENLKNATLEETDTEFIVSGTLDYSTFAQESDSLNTIMGMEDTMDLMSTLDVVITFDKEVGNYKTIVLSIPAGTDAMGLTLDEYKVEMENKGYSTDEITVPEDVKANAVSSDATVEDLQEDEATTEETTVEE